jgi:hypothetical protein
VEEEAETEYQEVSTDRSGVRKMVVDETEKYWRVRQRSPSRFVKFRVPMWALLAANTTSRGAKVVMGKTKKGGWLVQSILIRKRKGVGRARAVVLAKKIRAKIEKK